MAKPDILDEIISQIDPELIPTEFIVMAKVRTFDGMEHIMNGEDLEDYMQVNSENVSDVRVILDVKRIREQIINSTDDILHQAKIEF